MFGKKQEKKNSEIEQEEIKIDDKVVIYTMPKHLGTFKKSTDPVSENPTTDKNKKMGFLILITGGVILLILFVFLYLFLVGKDEVKIESNNDLKLENNADGKQDGQESKIEADDKNNNSNTGDKINTDDTQVKADENVAASSSAKVIESKIATSSDVFSKLAIDTDQDGLSDLEENLLASDVNSSDSDQDGYDDLSELLSMYNPSGKGTLLENLQIKQYKNDVYKYSFYYPSSWTVENIGGDESVLIRASNEQMFQIVVQNNSLNQSIDDWYLDQFNAKTVEPKQVVLIGDIKGIKSNDGLFVYFVYKSDIYSVSYNLGLDEAIYFKNLFSVLTNSFKFE